MRRLRATTAQVVLPQGGHQVEKEVPEISARALDLGWIYWRALYVDRRLSGYGLHMR